MSKMVINKVLLFLISLIYLGGCGMGLSGDSIFDKAPDDMDTNTGCEQIIIDESKYNSAVSDDFTITDAFITGDSLRVSVQYGGGCGNIDFDLLTNGLFMESDPVQLDVLLSFTDNDPCEAVQQRMLCFDLTKLIVLYNDSYRTTEGTIIIRLADFDEIIGFDF
jgi:hypothetical protein